MNVSLHTNLFLEKNKRRIRFQCGKAFHSTLVYDLGQSPPIPGAGRKADKRAAPLQALLLIFVKVVAKTN